MKLFYVSKSDSDFRAKVESVINQINPSSVVILAESHRQSVFKGIKATCLSLKDLNKQKEWITFVNTFDPDTSLLVVDRVLKFCLYGDGSKKYFKDRAQKFNNVLVMDIVPFYYDPAELFYPFYLLGKGILGYGNPSAFATNSQEKRADGTIYTAHSLKVLQPKIERYYEQAYSRFTFQDRTTIQWQLSPEDKAKYDNAIAETKDLDNPTLLYNTMSGYINLVDSKFKALNRATKDLQGKVAVVINCLGKYPAMYRKHLENKNVNFVSFHSVEDLTMFDYIVLPEFPIVKPHDWLYQEVSFTARNQIIELRSDNNLERYFYNKAFNMDLRKEFDEVFGK